MSQRPDRRFPVVSKSTTLAAWLPSFRVQLALVTLAALALRIAYVMSEQRNSPVFGDALGYHEGANLLADGRGFIDPVRFEFAGLERESAAHPPLYVLYLAAWSFAGFDGPLAHRLASTLLGAATVLVAGLAGRRLAGDRAGILAAAFAAVYPHLFLNDGALLSESAAAAGVALSLLAIERYRERPGASRGAQLGGAFALAILGRAELALLVPLVALPLLWSAGPRAVRDRLVRLAAAGLAVAVLVGPWVGYNLTRFDNPVTLSNGLGATLLGGSCDGAFYGEKLGYWAECPAEQVEVPAPDPETAQRWRDDPEGTRTERQAYFARYLAAEPDESERDATAREAALEYIGDHRARFAVVVAARVGRIWNVFRPAQNVRFDADIEGRGDAYSWAALFAYYALVVLAVAGLVHLRRRGHPIWPYLVLAGIVTFSAAIAFGIQRYRLPVDVALPVLAAVAVDGFLRHGRSGVPARGERDPEA